MSKALQAIQLEPAVVSLHSRRRRKVPQPQPRLWPDLSHLRMSAEDVNARRNYVGGSDANIILSGEAHRVLQLWREKRGEVAAEDLSTVLPVMLGSWTEAFNRQWYQRQTDQPVTLVGASMTCSEYSWRRCTLDGFVKAKDAVFEAKHVGAFFRPEEVLARYMPQLQHNMAVKGCELGLLSVIYGNHKWEVYEIAADWLYQDELLIAEQAFWECVESGKPPLALPPPPPPRANATRELCFEGNNLWAASAADWLETREAAKRHVFAGASIKDLMEADVARAFGHGIEAKRSKSGAVTIKELAE
jgi:predicted phage-related endonuclease